MRLHWGHIETFFYLRHSCLRKALLHKLASTSKYWQKGSKSAHQTLRLYVTDKIVQNSWIVRFLLLYRPFNSKLCQSISRLKFHQIIFVLTTYRVRKHKSLVSNMILWIFPLIFPWFYPNISACCSLRNLG